MSEWNKVDDHDPSMGQIGEVTMWGTVQNHEYREWNRRNGQHSTWVGLQRYICYQATGHAYYQRG